MPMITDWLMVGITCIYVLATILICVYNAKSAKATREQVAESKRQFYESKRLETMPFLQLETPVKTESPLFEIELDFCEGDPTDTIYKIVRLKNLGNGSAANINYSWKGKDDSNATDDYPPINAIMNGDNYYLQLTINVDETIEDNASGVLMWHYNDLLGNSYEQKVILIFDEGDLIRCENDIPQFLGVIGYKLADTGESAETSGEEKNNA